MTETTMTASLTVDEMADLLWRRSLEREGKLAPKEPLPEALRLPPRQPRVSATVSACETAVKKADALCVTFEDAMTYGVRKASLALVACVLLACAGALTVRGLVRDDPRAMDVMKDAGRLSWDLVREG